MLDKALLHRFKGCLHRVVGNVMQPQYLQRVGKPEQDLSWCLFHMYLYFLSLPLYNYCLPCPCPALKALDQTNT